MCAVGGWSTCPLFQVLILHNNELKSLVPKGCDIGALATLKVIKIFVNYYLITLGFFP